MSEPEGVLKPGALCTVEEVQAMLKLTDKPVDPAELVRCIEGATDAIQTFAKRTFTPDAEESERVYARAELVDEGWLVLTGDMNEITSVRYADATDVAYATYPLSPLPPGYPSQGLVLASPLAGPLTVTGKWGWPACPEDVHYAAIQQAAAWYTLDSSRLSDSWSNELGGAARPTPVARSLLYGVKDTVRPYRLVSMG